MRKFLLLLVLAVGSVTFQACETADANPGAEFWARGNCGMCEERIVTTLNAIEGVSDASWDKASGMVSVSFDETKTSEDNLQQALAAVGHSTKTHEASAEVDASLPKCCRAGGDKH